MAYTPPNQAAIGSQNALTAASAIVAAGITAGQIQFVDAGSEVASLRELFFDRTMEVVGETPVADVGGSAPVSSGSGSATLTFGKYEGRTIEDLVSADKGYVTWLAQNAREPYVKNQAAAALANA